MQLSEEQKKMVVSALQNEVDGYKKKIAELQGIIRSYTISDVSNGVSELQKKRKSKDSGWIARIKSVLELSGEPLTSTEILKRILAENPELEDGTTNLMGSLSPALNGASGEDGVFIRKKLKGSFATFELADKNDII